MITLKVEVEQYTIIQNVLKATKELADRLNIAVEFEYHNTPLRISPTSSVDEVYNYWKEANKHIIKSYKTSSFKDKLFK